MKEIMHPMPLPLPRWFTVSFWVVLATTLILQAGMTKPALTIGGAILGVMAVYAVWRHQAYFKLPRLAGLVGACVVGFLALSALWGFNAPTARHDFFQVTVILILGLALFLYGRFAPLPSWRTWGRLNLAITVGAIYIGLSMVVGYQWQIGFFKIDGFEPTDFNKPIAVLVMLAPPLLYPLWIAGGYWRGLMVVALALLAVLVASSYAQASLLGLIVILLAIIVPVQSRRFWVVVRATTIVGIMTLPFVMTPIYHHYATSLKENRYTSTAAMAERLEIWSAIQTRITEQPVFGYGYNAARILPMPVEKRYFFDPIVAHPHNFIMQTWLEAGMIGALLVLGFFLALWRGIAAEKFRPTRRLYFMSASTVVSLALVGWNMWQGWWLVMIFITAMLTLMAGRMLRDHPLGPR